MNSRKMTKMAIVVMDAFVLAKQIQKFSRDVRDLNEPTRLKLR